MLNKEQKEFKILELDRLIQKPHWGIILRIPKAMVRIAQGLLGLSEFGAAWLVAKRYTDVELPESPDGLGDDLYISKSLDFGSQTILLSITSTVERKGMYIVTPGGEYPHYLVRQ
jgi:hypothetical protein